MVQPVDVKGSAAASGKDEADFINVNRRHLRDFNKHKSSHAMKTLLKADDGLLSRQQAVARATEIASKTQFESKRNKEDPQSLEKRGILNHKSSRASKSKQNRQPT